MSLTVFSSLRPCRASARRAILGAAALLSTVALVAAPLSAQEVGYPPSRSPYRDIESPQRFFLYGGYLAAGKDELGAAPGSAPMIGLQYEVTIGGPAQFYVRASRASSERNAYNPASATQQSLGKISDPFWMADLGFSFNLTGQKTWHNIVPVVAIGAGVASARQSAEKDPYNFGTQFAFTGDFTLRYVPGNTYDIRVGVGTSFYQNHYPSAYYTAPTGGTALLTSTAKTSYLNSWRFTAGMSYPIFR